MHNHAQLLLNFCFVYMSLGACVLHLLHVEDGGQLVGIGSLLLYGFRTELQLSARGRCLCHCSIMLALSYSCQCSCLSVLGLCWSEAVI